MNKWIKSAGIVLLAAAFLPGCSSSSKMSLSDMGAKGLQMAYKPKAGSSAKYRMTMNQKMTQEMMGQESKFDTSIETMVTLNVNSSSADAVAYGLKYDSIEIDTNLPSATQFDSYKEKLLASNITIESDASGNVKSVSGLDAVKEVPVGANMEVSLKQLFVVFSPKTLKIGDSWTIDNKEDVTSAPLEIEINSSTVYTFAGIETNQNRKCFKFDFESKSTLSGAGNQGGAELEYDGVGLGKGQIFFDYLSGLIVSSTATESSEGVVSVPAQGMDIPVTTNESSTRVLVE